MPTKKAFHATPTVNLPSILCHGILPRLGERSYLAGEKRERVYLFSSHESLEEGISNWLGDEFDEDVDLTILAVDISELQTYMEVEYEIITDYPILPHNINILNTLIG